MPSVQKRLDDALVWLVFNDPLLQEFVDYLKLTPSEKEPTASVRMDHNYILCNYNEKWFDSLDDTELRTILKHELWHVILAHVFCRLSNHMIDNMAADIEINQEPFLTVPPTMKGDKNKLLRYDLFQMPAAENREFYYKKLLSNMESGHCGGDCSKCREATPEEQANGMGFPCPKNKNNKDGQQKEKGLGPIDSHEDWGKGGDAMEEVWRDRVEKAIEASEAKGNISSNMVEKIRSKWKKHRNLARLLRRVVGKEVSSSIQEANYWRRRNKRFPRYSGTRSVYGPKFVVAVDTSGSMSTQELEDVYSLLRWIKRMGYDGTLLQCDADVKNVTNVGKIKAEIDICGRGGTSSKPVFEWVTQNKVNPDMLIFFSDMETDFPDQKPPYKVIWVHTRPEKGVHVEVPFGKLIGM